MADAQNAERAAKRARSGSGDAGAGPSNASAAAAPAAPAPASSAQLPDLPIDVLTHLAEECWPASVFFDEGDVCRDAAACMLVGSAPFTALGAALYATVSPLAGSTDVNERSKAAEMKALLKVCWWWLWGCLRLNGYLSATAHSRMLHQRTLSVPRRSLNPETPITPHRRPACPSPATRTSTATR